MKIPKVFISYSHDTLEHKRWVLELATRLRNNGIDSVIDQWDLKPGDDLPVFMEKQLTECDRVIMVCTDRYVEKADNGSGGVGYEKMIITADLSQTINTKKVVPIIRQAGTNQVPIFLKTKLFINFSKDDDFESSYDDLVREIHDAPLFKKPDIGNNPFQGLTDSAPEKSVDSLIEAMSIIISVYENSSIVDIPYDLLIQRNNSMSRSLLDLQINIAQENGYIKVDLLNRIKVLPAGSKFAIEHKLTK
jgi:hypothetical protein